MTERAADVESRFAGTVLAAGRSLWWDATSTIAADRRRLLVLAAEHQARAVAVVTVPTLADTLARNARRSGRRCQVCGFARRVPEEVVRRMHLESLHAVPGLREEGWDGVVVLEAGCELRSGAGGSA